MPMNHGFNVLVEKPFARTAAEVDTMIETAAKNKVMLAVFQQSRFAPYYRQVRKVLDSGVLGRLIQVSIQFDSYGRRWDWQCCQRFNGGSLYNTGPHPVDQALDILVDWDTMPTVFSKLDRVNTFGDASAGLYQTIYDHLTQGTPLVVTPHQAWQQIAVMEEVHRQNPLSVFA